MRHQSICSGWYGSWWKGLAVPTVFKQLASGKPDGRRVIVSLKHMPEIRTTTSPGTRVLDETESEQEPPYHLVLLDDDSHTYQYVIRMLNDLFGYSPEKGYACVVDSAGRAIVMTDARAKVEQKQEQIHSYGADPLMETSAGSMSAVVEAAE